MTRLSAIAAAYLLLAPPAAAQEDEGWDRRLADRFSHRLGEIGEELAGLAPRLAGLPAIPIDDQGGSGGYWGVHYQATPPPGTRFAVEVRWGRAEKVDLIALVPARRYDAAGLDAQFGLPEEFTVELLDAAGEVVQVVGKERRTGADPVRHGHPFLYRVQPAVEASALRISAGLLRPSPDADGTFMHVWAEAMVFAAGKNLAAGAQVRSSSGDNGAAPWRWSADFLIDGQTPLGLPEVPAEHANIGWLSEAQSRADQPIAVTVDLGTEQEIDGVRLLPARKPTSDLPSGFGFPRALEIEVERDDGEWAPAAAVELANPGHNPVVLRFAPVRGRLVRVRATRLWKEFENYPAYFALSELEVLSGGENLALHRPAQSPDGMMSLVAPGGRIWSSAALCDGFGPDGRLVPVPEWLALLDLRLQLETRRHRLQAESARLVAGWRRTGRIVLVGVILAGAFLIVVLPIRYRLHANRELLKIRERIAGDLHDEVGSNLGSIQMFADLAEGRAGPSDELKRIQRIAAETVSAVRDIVWLLRPSGDHRIATVEHLRETASIMLESLDWKFTASEAAWGIELPEESNRDLFLYFREALHNIMRHSQAGRVEIRVEHPDSKLQLIISDNGSGIEAEKLSRPATLRALRQRAAALGGDFHAESAPGQGTKLVLQVPLDKKRAGKAPR